MANALDRIIESTFEFSRVMRHHMMRVASEGQPVNFLQVHALSFIQNHPGMTMKELADALHVTSPSATTFVNRLVNVGWVKRQNDPENRKLVRLKMTPKGTKVAHQKMKMREQAVRKIFGTLSKRDQEDLARILHNLLAMSSVSSPL